MWSVEKCKYVGNIIEETVNAQRMKDVAIMLKQVEKDTGYGVDFLWDVIKEGLDDEQGWRESVDYAITVAYEFDY